MAEMQAVRAPELAIEGVHWLNVAEPLPIRSLRGKLVMLDFWTFCCINCIHVLPTLRRIEDAFPDEVAVIGVHSPKFAHERGLDGVRAAVARYDIRHPVIHDPDMQLWRQYAVRAWPTLVFVDPNGHVLGATSGEPDPRKLIELVSNVLDDYRMQGAVLPRPLPLASAPAPGGRLSFPGKIKPLPPRAGESGRRWALADAGHHQIVILDDSGAELMRIGSGEPGRTDGLAEAASFSSPQGLAADEAAIYIADTANHMLRRYDRATRRVETLAGTGRRGRPLAGPSSGDDTALASPWDCTVQGSTLHFANAGTHQLGALDLRKGAVWRLAGSGGEDIIDGPAEQAQLAQPSGLALSDDGGALYFADSETSALRVLRQPGDAAARVETLIGTGLFDFGHRDGAFDAALLQHPLGVAVLDEQRLLLADSYNHRLRLIDLAERRVRDLDDGFTCLDPVCLPMAGEPAGVWADREASPADPRILMSDTNSHRVLEIFPARRSYRTWAS